ncbi:hypothetical protein V8C86DRAFT_2488938 [Haematococcus lacustris]
MDPGHESSRPDYIRNKNTQYNCKAKGLLYGGDGRPVTPVHHGKKSVAHANEQVAAPFATFDNAVTSNHQPVQGGQIQKTFQARHTKKDGAGKVGSAPFEADVYREQLAANNANLSAQRTRNWNSAGLLGQHSTPQA